ncbi:MAG: GNAT family N-acetyltransferase [Arthrobacter sp.]|uniref:GNAT family N-acetyltransferase n=1 Tax=Arthrobacter sp. TaxID=1667 RepID=UPI0034812DD7
MGWEKRHITAEDVRSWSVLTNILAAHDDTDETYEPEDLAEELVETGVDPVRDTVAAWDGETMVGYAQVRVNDGLRDGVAKASIGGGVHPDYRGRGLGRELMDTMEQRARAAAAEKHPGVPALVEVWGNAPGSGGARLAQARGYDPVRYFRDMRVDLDGWEEPRLVSGGTAETVPFAERHAEAVRRAHNEAFADHWGSTPRSEQKWADMLKARSFRPAYSRIVLSPAPGVDPDEAVDAYLLSGEWAAGELYVMLVGTRRRARGRGHAAHLLVDVIREARDAGYKMVDLGVDSESPTGAVGLYERVGFRGIRTHVVLSRAL